MDRNRKYKNEFGYDRNRKYKNASRYSGNRKHKKGFRYKSKRKHVKRRFLLTASVVFLILSGGRFVVPLLNHLTLVGITPNDEGRMPLTRSAAAEGDDSELQLPVDLDVSVDLTDLYSRYAILVDNASGITLAEHDARKRIYPASLTKIMTAVLAVENTVDMEEEITIPADFFDQLYAEDASMAGFLPGEHARLRDLLYGILLPSGAECCMTFAYRIAGSEPAFVEMMNRKAEELGLVNTHFCNATGLHDPDHYSTVEDISILLRYALQKEAFREAFTCSRYSTLPSEQHPDGFTFVSTMFQYMDSAEVTGGKILGGKTGYTEEAGQCLASLGEVGGREYILVTAKAKGTHETEQFHILDAENVYSQIGRSQ